RDYLHAVGSLEDHGFSAFLAGSLQVCGKIDRASGSESIRLAPTTISVPSPNRSPEISVTRPSERPMLILIGLTRSPCRIQRTPVAASRKGAAARADPPGRARGPRSTS